MDPQDTFLFRWKVQVGLRRARAQVGAILQRFADCDGFFAPDVAAPSDVRHMGPAAPAAVAHFRRLLAKHAGMEARHSAARLLARTPPAALLARGLALPGDSAMAAADGAFLAVVRLRAPARAGGDLARCGRPCQRLKSADLHCVGAGRSAACGSAARAGERGRVPRAQAGLAPEQAPRAKAKAGGARAAGGRARRWRQPWHLDQLRLDAAALAAALAAGAPGRPGAGTRDLRKQGGLGAACARRLPWPAELALEKGALSAPQRHATAAVRGRRGAGLPGLSADSAGRQPAAPRARACKRV